MDGPATAFAARLARWRETPEAEQHRAVAARASDLETRIAMAAETCPSASGPCGCGSGPPRSCGREGRPAEVRAADCLRCVTLEWWTEELEPRW